MRDKKKLLSLMCFLLVAGLLGFVVIGSPDQSSRPVEVPFGKYAPKQPIDYSHKLHAGDLQIECQFCHTYARRSRSAGIPAVEQCMACHTMISPDKEPIAKIVKAYDEKEPIEWVKVHDIPDYVYFSHKRHVNAGFECQECHGPVEKMEVLYREAPMTMGWCVNCHQDNRDKGAQLDCWTCHK
ncbi:MAG: cytochrome c3 family protein [Acidobacteriota bacterium]|nr:cytochrome c3 family protein [Acidobacteriota bacterium]